MLAYPRVDDPADAADRGIVSLHRALVVALLTAACTTPPQLDAGKPTQLELDLLAALQAEAGEVRLQAVQVFERCGTVEHVEAVSRLLDQEDAELRAAALRALGLIADRDAAAGREVLPFLERGLRDGVVECQQQALFAMMTVSPRDWREVEGLVGSSAWQLRIAAILVLALHGQAIHPNDLAMVLRDAAGTYLERRVRYLLPLLTDPQQSVLLAPYLESPELEVRFIAEEAAERLRNIAAGTSAAWRPSSQVRRELYRAQNDAARKQLAKQQWREVGRDDLIARAGAARLVLFGELHDRDGPLREAQCEVLKSMARHRREQLVLGFEPSVKAAQQQVIELAEQLGVEARATEVDWKRLQAAGRYAERDDETATSISTCLSEHPDRRMLVVRGEGHLLPSGYLCRQLPTQPLIVLSLQFPPLRMIGEPSSVVGRTFQLGDDAVYCWCCYDPLQGMDELAAWIDARSKSADASPRR